MNLIDHNDALWRRKWRRTNGAETYSEDICRYQLDNWKKILGPSDVLSTCPPLSQVRLTGRYRIAVGYLHKYPYKDPILWARLIRNRMLFEAKRVVFISAYKEFADALNNKGVETVFIPMSIDLERVRSFTGPKTTDKLLWFGNVDRPKRGTFNLLRNMTQMDVIAGGKFNGTPVTQEDAWRIASGYRYGVAVGRCALELYALGLKVLIAGTRCGGLVMTEADARRQEETNYNARYFTHNADPAACLNDLPDSIIPDIPDIRSMNHASL